MIQVFAQEPDIDALGDALGDNNLDAWDWGQAAIILAVGMVLGRAAKLVIARLIRHRRGDDFLADLIGRITGYLIVTFGFVYALESLGVAIGPLLGALGIAGVALAFALQDLLENFVAGIMLQLRRPFGHADEIISGDHEGRVLSIDARSVTITTPDGERVEIPSAEVLKNPIVNLTTEGRRRTTVVVGVAYGTDLTHATDVTLAAAVACDEVVESPPPRVFVETFGASSIDLAVHFWHRPRIADVWSARHQVALAIDTAFRDNDITIPFPQRTLHFPHELTDE